jgi:hypothetical protein
MESRDRLIDLWREVKESITGNIGTFDKTEMQAANAYYLNSFSTLHDDLNQYRVYGGKTPYALRFSKTMLQELAQAQGFELIECNYSIESLNADIETLIGDCEEQYRRLDAPPVPALIDMRPRVVSSMFWQGIADLAPRFKHPAYEAEQEWRLVSKRGNAFLADDSVQFRTNGNRLTPFIEFHLTHETCPHLAGPHGKSVALREVRLGPSSETSRDLAATVHLIMARGYAETIVSSSLVPHRLNS